MSNTANPATSKRPESLKITVDVLYLFCYYFGSRDRLKNETAWQHFMQSRAHLKDWSDSATEETFTDSVVKQFDDLSDTLTPRSFEF